MKHFNIRGLDAWIGLQIIQHEPVPDVTIAARAYCIRGIMIDHRTLYVKMSFERSHLSEFPATYRTGESLPLIEYSAQ